MKGETPLQQPTYRGIIEGRRCEDIQREKTKKVLSILTTKKTKESIVSEASAYIHTPVLQEFFEEHPMVWMDLIRELHSCMQENIGDGSISIPERDYDKIFGLFVIRGRKADIGRRLQAKIPEEIIRNEKLLRFCKKQPSLLDSSSTTFDLLDGTQLENAIRGLIVQGLVDNIDGCTYDNIKDYLPSALQKFSKYVPLAFGKSPRLYDEFLPEKSLNGLVSRLINIIKNKEHTKYGTRRLDAMRLVQAFHAWGNIDAIEDAQEVAENYAKPENMKRMLWEKAKIKLHPREKDAKENEKEEFFTKRTKEGIIYEGYVTIKGASYKFHWRAKSLVSILRKLWETPEYTNFDAMRDALAMSIECSDNTNEIIINEVFNQVCTMLPMYGYIAKNKGLIHNFHGPTGKNHKEPIYYTDRIGDTTNPMLQNISAGGFVCLNDCDMDPCGAEVQIIKTSAFTWKKKEDPLYKVRGIINLHGRGDKYITPNNLYDSLNTLISSDAIKDINTAIQQVEKKYLKIQTINDVLFYLIKQGFLLIYENRAHEVVFVPKKYRSGFEESMQEGVWEELQHHEHGSRIKKFIESLRSSESL